MVDTKTPGDKTLSVSKTLTLKPRVETGTVRQSFSHGRTKQVVVEKRGKRRVGGDAPDAAHAPEPAAKAAPAKPVLTRPADAPVRGRRAECRASAGAAREARAGQAGADAPGCRAGAALRLRRGIAHLD